LKQTQSKIRFVVGPPGTGKTHIWILEKYKELYKLYGADKLILLSHTNVATKELRAAIKNLDEIKNDPIIQEDVDDFLEKRIRTIHAYCKAAVKTRREVFSKKTDYPELLKVIPLMNLAKGAQKIIDPLKKHPVFRCISEAHGRGLTIAEHWNSTEAPLESYKPYNNHQIMDIKKAYEEWKKENFIQDYNDMIDNFNKSKNPHIIDALIVDEAQDSNVPQLTAIEKMSEHVKDGHLYFVGDPNQTIFKFSGSNPELFEKLARTPYKELEVGKRCSEAINEYCKRIIKPIWDHYDYKRVWTPTEVKGSVSMLPNLKGSQELSNLLNKINNSNESFLFTFRAEKSKQWLIPFLHKYGFKYSPVGGYQKVSDAELNSHYSWPLFLKGVPQSLDQIKAYWKHMDKEFKLKDSRIFKKMINRDYTFQEFVNLGYLSSSIAATTDFYNVCKKVKGEIAQLKFREKIMYIRSVINNNNLNQKAKIEYGNFHTVKGITRDNVIIDLSITRPEPYFEQLYLAYVGCSRGRNDLWVLRTQTGRELGRKNEYVR
tara:strand:- start:1066 stop:2694 length:1629 start_codon:yes stop_codon:yes gene_type:complete